MNLNDKILFAGGLSQIIGKVRIANAEKTDERIKLMSEVINGIQVSCCIFPTINFE